MHRELTANPVTVVPEVRAAARKRLPLPSPRPSGFGRLFAIVGVLMLVTGMVAMAAVMVGKAQPPSEWVQILHLEDCAFPCWLGITVGETEMEQARATLRQVFGTSPAYEVREESYQNFWTRFFVTRTEDGQGFMLYLNSIDGGETVRQLEVWPIDPEQRLPSMAELGGVLGAPTGVGYEYVMDQPVLRVVYQGNALRVGTTYPECGRVDFTQTVESIRLDDAAYASGLSAEAWRGFGRCYFAGVEGL